MTNGYPSNKRTKTILIESLLAVLRRSVVTSGETQLRGLAPGQHSSEEMSQRWRVVGNNMSGSTGSGNERRLFCGKSGGFSYYANHRYPDLDKYILMLVRTYLKQLLLHFTAIRVNAMLKCT